MDVYLVCKAQNLGISRYQYLLLLQQRKRYTMKKFQVVVVIVVLFSMVLMTGCGGDDSGEQYSAAQKMSCSVACTGDAIADSDACQAKCLETLDSGDTLETALETE